MSASAPRILLADFKGADITGEIPALFHRAGYSFDVYCPKHSWLLKSRYRNTWHEADNTDTEAYAEGLRRLASSHPYEWIVFVDDFSLRAAHDHLDENVARKLLPITDPSYKALTSSKAALSILSHQHDILTPTFAVHDGTSDILQDVRGIPFPLLLKVDRSGGGKGISYCEDENSLVSAYASLQPELRRNLLIQTYIAGENIAAEALFHKGKLLAHARARVLQNIKGEFSASCAREYRPHPGLEAEIARIGSTLGFDGFCSFTFIHDAKNDAHYLVEADLRTHAWFALSRFAGVDFAQAIQNRMADTPLTLTPRVAEVRHFSRDIIRSMRSGDLKNLWAWIRNEGDRWRFIPSHDKQLFITTAELVARTLAYEMKPLRPLGRLTSNLWKKLTNPNRDMATKKDSALGFFIDYLKKEKILISLGLSLSIVQTAMLIPIPFFTKKGFDAIVSQQDSRLLISSLVWVMLLLTGGTLCMLVHRYITLKATKSIMASIRERLLARMLSLDFSFYATEDLDGLHAKIVQDTERIDRAGNRVLTQTLPALLITAGLSCVLLYLDPLLAVVISIFVPVLYLLGRRMGVKVRESVRIFHTDFSNFSSGVSFLLKFHELISVSGAGESELARQESRVRTLQHSSARMAWLATVYSALQNNVVVICGAIALVAGGLQVLNGISTIGSVISFYIALNIAAVNARTILSSIPAIIEGGESFRSLSPYLATMNPKTAGARQTDLSYPLEFKNVSFDYQTKAVLRDVSFSIHEHTVTGIFGASGSGKTTLIRLLLGLYAPTQGTILAGGQDIRTWDAPTLRRSIGVLPQEPLLFPGSIRDNLSYGIECSDETMAAICSLCRIHDTISSLPDGYDSIIGHRGVTLSGGEKQRIAIARALLRKPRLLILDEPDNNLDSALIGGILHDAKASGHTIILISHDQSLRTLVDHALTVSGGTVTQSPSGGHESPLTRAAMEYFGGNEGVRNQAIAS